ncbi:hypothetical protein ACIRD2_30440 [Streptomyces sp. NPDC093595]|uniref:hypothetical protein n=1 Tax=Streptomyces sp. NPDC093595 TaxID=3366045 RepID=UPI0037F99C38
MPTNMGEPPAVGAGKGTGRGGGCCCLVLAVLPLAWFVAAPLLPESVFWFPSWLGAVIWNGTDGQGGISHLFG